MSEDVGPPMCARCGHMWEMHAESGRCQAVGSVAPGSLQIVECRCSEYLRRWDDGLSLLTDDGPVAVKPFDEYTPPEPEPEVYTPRFPLLERVSTCVHTWFDTVVTRGDVAVFVVVLLFVRWAF